MTEPLRTGWYRYVSVEDIPAYLEMGWVAGLVASPHSIFMWAPEGVEPEDDDTQKTQDGEAP